MRVPREKLVAGALGSVPQEAPRPWGCPGDLNVGAGKGKSMVKNMRKSCENHGKGEIMVKNMRKSCEKSSEKHGTIMENHGNIMEPSWENHGEIHGTMGKPWES